MNLKGLKEKIFIKEEYFGYKGDPIAITKQHADDLQINSLLRSSFLQKKNIKLEIISRPAESKSKKHLKK